MNRYLISFCLIAFQATQALAGPENLALKADQSFLTLPAALTSSSLRFSSKTHAKSSAFLASQNPTVISASGLVSGELSGICPMTPFPPMGGTVNTFGYVRVSGNISINQDGLHGQIQVSGGSSVMMICANGIALNASGLIPVSGEGPVYDAQGKLLGNLFLRGKAYVSGNYQLSGIAQFQGVLN